MRVLELGSYIAPAYAGMILAEQGHEVTKLTNGNDPILGLDHGADLWAWINHQKELRHVDVRLLALYETWDGLRQQLLLPMLVLDNFRQQTLDQWGIFPRALAEEYSLVWVSLRSETPELHQGRSFDVLAQARSWMQYGPYVPAYVGDTTAGLWMAFKALSAVAQSRPGHYVLGQASCMQKLIEGELLLDVPRDLRRVPWDRDLYFADADGAVVEYKGELIREPIRRRAWKLEHLWHDQGRIRI